VKPLTITVEQLGGTEFTTEPATTAVVTAAAVTAAEGLESCLAR